MNACYSESNLESQLESRGDKYDEGPLLLNKIRQSTMYQVISSNKTFNKTIKRTDDQCGTRYHRSFPTCHL